MPPPNDERMRKGVKFRKVTSLSARAHMLKPGVRARGEKDLGVCVSAIQIISEDKILASVEIVVACSSRMCVLKRKLGSREIYIERRIA